MSGTKRNPYFDMLKGIGIIAVVGGHCILIGEVTGFMCVWRMPLFFLVSGYFFHPKPFKDYLRGNVRGLLVPYALTTFVLFLLSLGLYYTGSDTNPINAFIAIFVGSCGMLPLFEQYSVGPLWFLLALFWCKELYDCIYRRISSKYIMGGVILVLFLLTVNSCKKMELPMSLFQGINAMLFFHIGHIAAKHELAQKPCKWQWVVLTFMLLAISLYFFGSSLITMGICEYSCWPLNVVTALGCVYTLLHLCVWLGRSQKCRNILTYWGSISLLVICVHTIDLRYAVKLALYANEMFFHLDHWQKFLYIDAWHLSVALIGSWVLAKSTIIRQIFQIKR